MFKDFVALFAVAASFPASAAVDVAPARVIFKCAIGTKVVRVTQRGKTLTYTFGRAERAAIAISGDPDTGNILYQTQRYSGREQQLRFVRGAYSYIVWTVEGNAMTGTPAFSGLTVKQGLNDLSSKSCDPADAHFVGDYDFSRLPVDDPDFTGL